MKLLLTGAAGKLGAPVCRHLVAAGHEVRATDRVDRTDLPVPLQVADLLRSEMCYPLLEGTAALVHLANHPHSREGDSQRIFNENVTMNMNIFQAARETGVKKIVFASSIQVLSGGHGGRPPYLPFDSALPPQPANPYSLSKKVTEDMLAYFARQAEMEGVAIRFPWLVDDALLQRIRSDGSWAKINPHEGFAFLHVGDAATLIEAILRQSLPGYRVYFPAAPDNGLRRPVADVIREYYPDVPLRRPLEEIAALVDTSVITRETGWSAVHSRL